MIESFLRGHVHAFDDLEGPPHTILYDNLRSAVLERHGDAIPFHPRLLELCSHYHFVPRPYQAAWGNQKGRVERAIQYIRHSFFAARPFTTLQGFNRQALLWRDALAHRRPWPRDDSRTVEEVFAEEKPRLLPLPVYPFNTDLVLPIQAGRIVYIRFDLNDYSIPPTAVGRPLMLLASETTVRILNGQQQIARHRRSYDRHEFVVDPAHWEALLAEKRKAAASAPGGCLASRRISACAWSSWLTTTGLNSSNSTLVPPPLTRPT